MDEDNIDIFRLYLKSVESDNSYEQNSLENCYQNGISIAKNEKKAYECYLKFAKGSNSIGQYNNEVCYFHGIGTTAKDEKKCICMVFKIC